MLTCSIAQHVCSWGAIRKDANQNSFLPRVIKSSWYDIYFLLLLIVCLANNQTVNPLTCPIYWSFLVLARLSYMFYIIVDVFKSPLRSLSLESLFFVITHIYKYVGGVKNLWGNQPDMKHRVEGWKYPTRIALSLIFEPLESWGTIYISVISELKTFNYTTSPRTRSDINLP